MNNLNNFLSFKEIMFNNSNTNNNYIDLSKIKNDYSLDINISFNESKEKEFIIYGSILKFKSNSLDFEGLYINLVEPHISNNNLSYKIIEKQKIKCNNHYKFLVNSTVKNVLLLVTIE